MTTTWTAQLECRWSEIPRHVDYNPPWLHATLDTQPANIPPDCAILSPFGVAAWYQFSLDNLDPNSTPS